MSDLSQDPAPKKRVVRSRVAAASSPAVEAAPAPSPAPAPAPAPKAPAAGQAAAPSPSPAPRGEDAAANAALAVAVMAARREAPAAAAAAIPAAPPSRAGRAAALMRRPAVQAAALVVAAAAGWLGAEAVAGVRAGAMPAAPWTEAAQTLRQSQQDVVRLTGDIKALKVTIESLKESVDRSKTDLMAKQTQVVERIERAPGDAGRLAKLVEQLERIEASAKEPAARFAALTERFDRMERQIERQLAPIQTAAAKPAPAPAAEGPTQTGTIEAKPAVKEPRDLPVEGWTLHEVYDGVALVEGRNRRLYEVGVGGVIPGVGAVESIERRNKRWVVVTQKGYIGG
ncbi:MAG TPA: hypothetical protein VHL98_17185 [Microvirga sp.]|jgi:hypothetical protein|nr:hypothetical protein [Microvirga sp.]